MRSPEVSGGAGFTLEAHIGAIYLTGLLQQSTAPGINDARVHRVAFQQSGHGEPLDDLIVDGKLADGSTQRLSLQAKMTLEVGSGRTNESFREVVHGSWATLHKPTFSLGIDRFGGATANVSDAKLRALTSVCEHARNTSAASDFLQGPGGAEGWSGPQAGALRTLRALLEEVAEGGLRDEDFHKFCAHFVVLKFDVLHEAATDRARTIAQLQSCLADGNASALFPKLVEVADKAKNVAGSLERKTLLSRLGGGFTFTNSTAAATAASRLNDFSNRSIEDIGDEIGGFHIDRVELEEAVRRKVRESRFAFIRGLPGSGKSAVLKRLAHDVIEAGPILFLHSSRVTGSSWNEFSAALNLGDVSLLEILGEIGHAGTPTLFIDGIDRLNASARNVAADVIRTILSDPDLANWNVVATVRDEGLEPLRNWLPEACFQTGSAICKVEGLDDDEAAVLAKNNEALAPFLFGSGSFIEIARRPFFAAVLAHQVTDPLGVNPSSEVDLIDIWWRGGGYAAPKGTRLQRNKALLELAKSTNGQIGQPVPVTRLGDGTVSQLADLISDGVVQEHRVGISVKFAHDIFHEWAMFQLLEAANKKWLEVVQQLGEPPSLGRVVGLISQRSFFSDDEWQEQLEVLNGNPSIRPQWGRAWLLAPISAPAFTAKFDDYASVAEADNGKWLEKTLLWFQAERTTPNQRVIENAKGIENVSAGDVIRFADHLAWPADYTSWKRILSWIIARADGLPPRIIVMTTKMFQVWQNALAGIPNQTSTSLLELSLKWLCSVEEERHPADFRNRTENWSDLSSKELENLEKELRELVIAQHSNPELLEKYINRLKANKRIGRPAFDQLMKKAAHLPSELHSELVDYILAMMLKPLPEEAMQRWEEEDAREREFVARERERLKDVPDEELSFSERMSLNSPGSIRPDFGMYEDMRLCLDDHGRSFSPPSPIREPFKSLLTSSPSEGLRLIRHLTNHAMECWRQLQRLGYRPRGTPLPLDLEFPWGKRQFWGTRTEYLWFRGLLGPQVLECALPALEQWAFDRAEAGDPLDEIIQDVVEGHECVAVLGIACSLAVAFKHVTAVTLPLVTCQRLWQYDIRRLVEDLPGIAPQLIGFAMHQHERSHIETIRKSNELESRRITIRELLMPFILGSDKDLSSKAIDGVLSFPEQLPFGYEEEAHDEDHVADLRQTAEIWVELAKPENYRLRETEEENKYLIEVENPKAEDPTVVEKTLQYERTQMGMQIQGWAARQFEAGTENLNQDELKRNLSDCMREKASRLLRERGYENGMLQSGVAAVAALAVIRDDLVSHAELKWAKKITELAERIAEPRGEPLIEQAKITWHPSIFAARAIAAELRSKPNDTSLRKRLLNLVAHPLESVADAALAGAFDCFGTCPTVTWAALDLALRLTSQERIFPRVNTPRVPFYPEPKVRRRFVKEVVKLSQNTNAWELPRPPAAWGDTGDFDGGGTPIQREPTIYLRWDRLARICGLLRVRDLVEHDTYRDETLRIIRSWLDWLVARDAGPSGIDEDHYGSRRISEQHELTTALCACLAKLYDALSVDQARSHSLDFILGLDDELCTEILSRMVTKWVAGGICDAEVVQDQALAYLSLSLERILEHHELDQKRAWRMGQVNDFNLSLLIRDYFCTSFNDSPALASARFANGDWTELSVLLPFAEKLVKQAGWVPSVASNFVSMCESGREHLPASWFADRALDVLSNEHIDLLSFSQFDIPARLATLVQQLADQTASLPALEASKLLRILDRLVDLGDRRSAALQLSPAFRNITLDNTAA